MELRYSSPTPGIENSRSIIIEPLKMPTNEPSTAGSTTTAQFLNACRTVACSLVKPFARASSIYSPVSTSVSSALVTRVKLATLPSASAVTGMMSESSISLEKKLSVGASKGGNTPKR